MHKESHAKGISSCRNSCFTVNLANPASPTAQEANMQATKVALRNFAHLHQVLFSNAASNAVYVSDRPFDYEYQCIRIILSRKGDLGGDPSQCFRVTRAEVTLIANLHDWELPTEGHRDRFAQEMRNELATRVDGMAGRLKLCLTVDDHVMWTTVAVPEVTSARKKELQENNKGLSWQEMLELVIDFGHVMHEEVGDDGTVQMGYAYMRYMRKKWQRVEMSPSEKQFYGYSLH